MNPDGSTKKIKARLVGGGNLQDRELYEQESISSPTVSVSAVLIIAALATLSGYEVVTADVTGAYLNADIGESNIYVTLDGQVADIYCSLCPEASEFRDEKGRLMVKLDKALYGCLESSKLWYENIKRALIDYGFIMNRKEPCVFNLFTSTTHIIVSFMLMIYSFFLTYVEKSRSFFLTLGLSMMT